MTNGVKITRAASAKNAAEGYAYLKVTSGEQLAVIFLSPPEVRQLIADLKARLP